MNNVQNNGRRLSTQPHDEPPYPLVIKHEEEQALSANPTDSEIQGLLAKIATPSAKLLDVLSKGLGSAEAEITFVEEITIRFEED